MKWGADVGGKRKQLEKKGCKVLKVENKENKNEEEEERIKEKEKAKRVRRDTENTRRGAERKVGNRLDEGRKKQHLEIFRKEKS